MQTTEPEPLGTRVVSNTLSNVARGAVTFPLMLIITPILVSKLGVPLFGVWALIQSFTSYVGLLDLGIGAGVAKYVAEYRATNHVSEINGLLNTAAVVYAAMGILATAVVFVTRHAIVAAFFKQASIAQSEIGMLLTVSVMVFCVNLLSGVFASLLMGWQRMDLANVSAVLGTTFSGIASVAVVLLGWGVPGLVTVNACTSLLTGAVGYLLARRQYPSLVLSPTRFRLSIAKQLLGLSLQYQVVSFASLIHAQLDKMILGYFVGVSTVAYYEIATRLISQLRSVPTMVLSPTLPAASELHAQQARESLRRLYYRSLKYVAAISFPMFILVSALAYPIIRIWVGEGYDLAALALQVLALANLLNMLTGPGGHILAGVGKPRYAVYSSLLGILLNVILSPLLVSLIGFKGAVLGTSLSMIIASVYFLILFHKVERLPAGPFLRPMRVAGLTASALGLGIMVAARVVKGLAHLLILCVLYGIAYCGTLLLLRWIEPDDCALVHRYLRRFLPGKAA